MGLTKSECIYPQEDWQWYGRVGHCCIGQWCRFHLLTKVGPWYVSTIGEYVHPRHSQGSEKSEIEWLKDNYPGEDIGAGRKYETMVFVCTDKICDCGCGQPTVKNWQEEYVAGYNDPVAARNGHLKACFQFSRREVEVEV